jgi:hypothetical protein
MSKEFENIEVGVKVGVHIGFGIKDYVLLNVVLLGEMLLSFNIV